MQVYKTFLKILRSKIGVAMIYLTIFLVIGISSANSSKETDDFKEVRVGVGITDNDNTKASKNLCTFLEKSCNVTYGEFDKNEKLDKLYYGQMGYYLTINEGFGEKLVSGDTEGILSSSSIDGGRRSSFIESKIDMYLTTARGYIASGLPADEALEKAGKALEKKVDVKIVDSSSGGFMDISYYFKFMPYILMSVLMFSLCPVIMILNEKEVRNRTLSSALPQRSFLMQITLGVLSFIVLIYLFVTVFVPLVVFGAEPTSELKTAMLNTLAFTLVCAAIVLLVSNVITNQELVSLVGNVIGLGMSFLCGVFVPMEYLGGGVKLVGSFLPAYWFEVLNSALAGLDGEVYSKELAVKCILIQLFFAVALFLATFALMKTRKARNLDKPDPITENPEN